MLLVQNLVEGGRLVKQDGEYELVKGACPLLDESDNCTVHKHKHELGLLSCMQFPIYYTPGIESLGRGNFIIADYRCQSVQKSWEGLYEELRGLQSQYNDIIINSERGVHPMVRFLQNPGKNTVLFMSAIMFEEMRRRGKVNLQRF